MSPKTVGLVVLEQMTAADLTGAAEAFSRAALPTAYGACQCRCYQVVTVGLTAEPCETESGLLVKPQCDFERAPPFDTLIVPGENHIPAPKMRKTIAKWLNYRAPTTRRIAALGTGIYALAATGLLDRRQVTTHWRFAKDVALRFPKLRVNPNILFIKDGPFYTCAGGTAAIDFSLALIEEDYGRNVALRLARDLVVHLKRPGAQEQYSEPLQFQLQSVDRFADLAAWILCNLSQDLSIETLSQRACMSPRNFTRVFTNVFAKTPAEFVCRARITEAQRRLLVPRNTIDNVAVSVGFKSADAFSRAFERHVGMRPSAYRARLGIGSEKEPFEWQPAQLTLAHA